MSRIVPLAILFLAVLLICFSLAGDDSYPRLLSLRESTSKQRVINSELRDYVRSMRREVAGLQTDERELEKAARNNLGLARPDELIFFFDRDEH